MSEPMRRGGAWTEGRGGSGARDVRVAGAGVEEWRNGPSDVAAAVPRGARRAWSAGNTA